MAAASCPSVECQLAPALSRAQLGPGKSAETARPSGRTSGRRSQSCARQSRVPGCPSARVPGAKCKVQIAPASQPAGQPSPGEPTLWAHNSFWPRCAHFRARPPLSRSFGGRGVRAQATPTVPAGLEAAELLSRLAGERERERRRRRRRPSPASELTAPARLRPFAPSSSMGLCRAPN